MPSLLNRPVPGHPGPWGCGRGPNRCCLRLNTEGQVEQVPQRPLMAGPACHMGAPRGLSAGFVPSLESV